LIQSFGVVAIGGKRIQIKMKMEWWRYPSQGIILFGFTFNVAVQLNGLKDDTTCNVVDYIRVVCQKEMKPEE
ncbi:hypothetical protein M8C21_026432, partial [Ambrosia artemisiifolia]